MNERYFLEIMKTKAASLHRYGFSEAAFDETAKHVATMVEEFSVNKGAYLQRIGIPAEYIYLLTKGIVRSGFYGINGEEVTVRFYAEGYRGFTSDHFFSKTKHPAGCFLIAETDVEGFRIKIDTLDKMAAEHPLVNKYRSELLEYQVKLSPDHDVNKCLSTAQERLATFRLEYPDLEARISKKILASYLNVTPQYMSELLRRK